MRRNNMRFSVPLSIAVISLITFTGCTKSSPSSTTTTPPTSFTNWTFNDTTYKGEQPYTDVEQPSCNSFGDVEIASSDTTGYITVNIAFTPQLLISNGTYPFSLINNSCPDSAECILIVIIDAFTANQVIYYSTGTGQKVFLTFAKGTGNAGTYTATFTNIQIQYGNIIKTLSGTLVYAY